MSNSESDSEDEIIRGTKRKFFVKFEFEDSDTSQSDGDVSIQPRTRRRRKLSTIYDTTNSEPNTLTTQRNFASNQQIFDDDSDESSDSPWCPDTAVKMPINKLTKILPSKSDKHHCDVSNDDISNGICPICLHGFREQEVGIPNICEHSFCAPCIEEWSKSVITCPIDRKEFSHIIVRDRFENAKMVRKIQVMAQSNILLIDDDAYEMTLCEICYFGGREDSMLLCDGCDLGYHMDCLNPPLVEVPAGLWYCSNCFVDVEENISESNQ